MKCILNSPLEKDYSSELIIPSNEVEDDKIISSYQNYSKIKCIGINNKLEVFGKWFEFSIYKSGKRTLQKKSNNLLSLTGLIAPKYIYYEEEFEEKVFSDFITHVDWKIINSNGKITNYKDLIRNYFLRNKNGLYSKEIIKDLFEPTEQKLMEDYLKLKEIYKKGF